MAGIEVQIRLKPVPHSAWSASDTVIFRQDNRFVFNHIHGATVTNGSLFRAIEPFVTAAFTGQNVTVMAYGQTGSGKTHSMLGTDSDKGFIPRAAETLLKLTAAHAGATLRGSCIEIYNETVRDLINVEREVVVSDVGTTVHVDRSSMAITSLADFIALSARAENNRRYAGTDMNERSSRSHTILSFETILSNGLRSTINFVDLAGSECTAKSNTAGQQLREGNFINKSLLALGNVVDAIVDGRSHVPYRESKLTRVLRPCLGGKSLAYILACVNPSSDNVSETTAALRFAQRSMRIKNDPTLTLNCPPLVAHTLCHQLEALADSLEATERAAFAKGVQTTYTYCLPAIEEFAAMADREAGAVADEFRQLQLAVLAREKKVGLDRIAEAESVYTEHAHAMGEVQQAHTRELKRLRDAERNAADMERRLAAVRHERHRAESSLARAEADINERIRIATGKQLTPDLRLEQYELNDRLRLQMEEREVFVCIVEDFAGGFPYLPEMDSERSAAQLMAEFREQIRAKRVEVTELEEAAALANEGFDDLESIVAEPVNMLVEERVFELRRVEQRLDETIRAATRSQPLCSPVPTRKAPRTTTPLATRSLATANARSRTRTVAVVEPRSPKTLLSSTLKVIHDVCDKYAPSLGRSPQPKRHVDPDDLVDLDQVVGIAARRRLERERSSPADASPVQVTHRQISRRR
jgi:hypothetical protein